MAQGILPFFGQVGDVRQHFIMFITESCSLCSKIQAVSRLKMILGPSRKRTSQTRSR